MTGDEAATERASVKTYVPAYQKEEWKRHAEELGMTQSEFVRTMVQAGRRGFDLGSAEPRASPSAAGGADIEDGVVEILSADDHLSWDELAERLAGDFEDRLEETLQRLQGENRVQYSGRHGGYTVVDDGR